MARGKGVGKSKGASPPVDSEGSPWGRDSTPTDHDEGSLHTPQPGEEAQRSDTVTSEAAGPS
eukprot:3078549-Heterocapsa_arctica.AAC.1